jgi:hypothetical protein
MESLKRAAACLLGFASMEAGAAQEVTWYSQIDNDIVFETDRWYTSGVRLARVHRSSESQRIEWGFVQELYTPDVKNLARRIDRPYVGRLYLTGARHDYLDDLHRTFELGAGVRGPAAKGPQSQDLIHRIIPGPETDWTRQLANRPDVQVIASYSHDHAFGTRGPDRAVVHYGTVLGNNVMFAHAGIELRIGGASAISSQPLRFAATPPMSPGKALGWSSYYGLSVRWLLRNTFLSRNENEFGPALERTDGVMRAAMGLAWNAGWGGVSFSLVQDSREFETQRRMHRYGVLGVHVDFL